MPNNYNSIDRLFVPIIYRKNHSTRSLKPLFVVLLVIYLLHGINCASDPWNDKVSGSRECSEKISNWLFDGAKPDKIWLMPRSGEKSLRKEYRTLSTEERHKFHRCLLKLKTTPAVPGGNLSQYDTFVVHHTFDFSPEAHDSPCFLGFHRVYLYILERLMRSHEGCHDTAMHYWDTTLDTLLPDPSDTVMFNHPDYFGNKEGNVTTGLFENWGPVVPEVCQKHGANLTRSLCNIQYALLLNQEVDSFVHCGKYEDCVKPKNERFEDAHGQVHNCIGGHMGDLMCAPNDPIFFLYHSFVDLVYQDYLNYNYPKKLGIDPADDYPKNNSKYYWEPDSVMYPFSEFKVIDGLSSNFSDNWVSYEERPRRCSRHVDCTKGRSDALWCDVRVGQCMAKVYINGSCETYSDDACYNDCKSNEEVFCDPVDSTCKCKVTSCYKDEDCVEVDELCDVAMNKCTKKVGIHEFCGHLPDRFCEGKCQGFNEVLRCIKGRCSCKMNPIGCNPKSPSDMCPIGFFCHDLGYCTPKMQRGQPCYQDKMCLSNCYQGYVSVCSIKTSQCRCVLKEKLSEHQGLDIPQASVRSFPESSSKKNRIRYCRNESNCPDRRQLCLRRWMGFDRYTRFKSCEYVRCTRYRECSMRGLRGVFCIGGYCRKWI